jgi:hypothetical protein
MKFNYTKLVLYRNDLGITRVFFSMNPLDMRLISMIRGSRLDIRPNYLIPSQLILL